jgi:YHYH protein
MKKYLLVYLTLLLNCTILWAHDGGHFLKSDEQKLHLWKSPADAEPFKGNLSFYKGDVLYLENTEGKYITIPFDQLSEEDKVFAESEISRLEALHTTKHAAKPIQDNFQNLPYFFVLLIYGGLSFTYFSSGSAFFRLSLSISFAFSLVAFLYACTDSKKTSISTTISKTDATTLEAVFAPFKASFSGLATRSDNTYFYVESSGFPSHTMMVGIRSWQQQVPVSQPYTGSNAWSIPLQPEYASSSVSLKTNLMTGAIAIAANGIPIFNPLNNRGDDAFLSGELDNYGGHCGKADDYHYHIAPLTLQATVGNAPIAVAFDGFLVYGSNEPDGTVMQNLDQYHGHTYNNGTYHYHGTSTYPYMIASMRGKITLDPNTTAPENQLIPQAKSTAFRPAGSPLNGASITNFTKTGTTAYSLEYTLNSKKGYLNYSWDASGNYTFAAISTDGTTTTTSYKR